MSRLRPALDALRARHEKALGVFLTCGFPAPAATLGLLEAAVAGGADFVELGMPFSDPLAEGPTIQRASARALAAGTTTADVFRTAEAFRARSENPLVLMGYVNPVLRYGPEPFCRDAAAAGADGLILPDLPPEEAAEVEDAASAAGLTLTYLVAPTSTDARIRQADARATGFVYAVSVAGLTGTGLGDPAVTDAYLRRARTLVVQNPLLVGFGIETAADAARLAGPTDGVIVGTAFVRLAETLWADEFTETERRARAADAVRAWKDGANTSLSPPD
jgi:tryptophan synthase alpha chain